jgi:Tsi6
MPMDTSEQLVLFKRALEKIKELELKEPQFPPFTSIHNQLVYLIDLVSGHADPKKLSEINLGYITMRELEPRDEKAADILYSASAEAQKLIELNS